MKMTTATFKTALISIAILFLGAALSAQEATPAPVVPVQAAASPAEASPAPTPHVNDYEQFKNTLGFHFSEYTGYGFSWQYWENGNGIQVNAGAMFGQGMYFGSNGEYSVGLEYQRQLFGGDVTDWLSGQVYFSAGIGHTGKMVSTMIQDAVYDSNYNLVTPAVYSTPSLSPLLNGGIGLGMEIILFQHFSLPVELGMAAFWDINTGALSVRMSPQVGFRYRF